MNSPQGCCGKNAAVPTFRFREFRIYLSLMEVLVVFLENCVQTLAGLDSVDAERRLKEEEGGDGTWMLSGLVERQNIYVFLILHIDGRQQRLRVTHSAAIKL